MNLIFKKILCVIFVKETRAEYAVLKDKSNMRHKFT